MTQVGNLDDFLKSMVSDLEDPGTEKQVKPVNTQEDEDETIEIGEEEEADTEEADEEESDESLTVEEGEGEEIEGGEEEVETGTEVELDDSDSDLLEFESEEEAPTVSEELKALSNDLGFGEIKSKEEFLEKAKALKQLQELQKDVPSDLAEALKVAKDGGDYRELLQITSIDYDSYSNKELVEASMEKYFKREDGSVDEESLLDYVESKSPAEINMLGDQVRDSLKAKQSQRKAAFEQSIAQKKAQENQKIKSYLDKVNSIAGVKLTSIDKEVLMSEISSGSIIDKISKNEQGETDAQKLVENMFKIKYFDKVLNIAKTKSVNQGKKEVIKKLTNSNVSKGGKQTRVAGKTSPTKSGLDSYIEALQKGI
jgi:hypothetical protein